MTTRRPGYYIIIGSLFVRYICSKRHLLFCGPSFDLSEMTLESKLATVVSYHTSN